MIATYKEKLAQADREAIATLVALVLTILVWIVGGFGLSGQDIRIFHTPIWIIGGTIGTWLFAIAAALFLEKKVFADFELESEEGSEQPDA